MKEWTTTEFQNTPSTTNLEEEEIVDARGNDGKASMLEQFKRLNPWRKMMMMMMTCKNLRKIGKKKDPLKLNTRILLFRKRCCFKGSQPSPVCSSDNRNILVKLWSADKMILTGQMRSIRTKPVRCRCIYHRCHTDDYGSNGEK